MDKDRSQVINNEPIRGASCSVGFSTTTKCPKCAPPQPRILWQSSLTGEIPRPSDMEEGLTGPQTRRETIDTCDEKASFRSRILPLAPWRRIDSWRGWAKEDIATSTLVPSLAVQAFATGILDATTYADFHTFASNRKSSTISLSVQVLIWRRRNRKHDSPHRRRLGHHQSPRPPHRRFPSGVLGRSFHLWTSRSLLWRPTSILDHDVDNLPNRAAHRICHLGLTVRSRRYANRRAT